MPGQPLLIYSEKTRAAPQRSVHESRQYGVLREQHALRLARGAASILNDPWVTIARLKPRLGDNVDGARGSKARGVSCLRKSKAYPFTAF